MVINGLNSILCIKEKMKRHNVLLKWIEQQRREIANNLADIEKEGDQNRSKRISSKALRNHSVNEASKFNKFWKTNDHKRKKSTARSILNSIDSAKVSKTFNKRRNFHQKMNVSYNELQTVKKTIVDFSISKSRSKRMFKIKNATSAFLRPIHSSKIFKFDARRPTRLCRNDTKLTSIINTHWLTKKDNLSTSSILSTNRKAMQQSAKASLRRSIRISKQFERFHSGYAWELAMTFCKMIKFGCTNILTRSQNKCWM